MAVQWAEFAISKGANVKITKFNLKERKIDAD